MRINNNIAAMNTYSRLASAQGAQAKSLEKLSSGLRINKAGDDAAGLAISEKMRGQVGGLNQAVRNAQDGISLIQTAEGGLSETHSILQRMRELAVQSSNDTNTDNDRIEIQKEMNQLSTEINRISANTEFNEKKLLNGDFNGKFQIGANKDQSMSLEVSDMSSKALNIQGTVTKGTVGGLDILSRNSSVTATLAVDEAAEVAETTVDVDAATGNITINVATKETATAGVFEGKATDAEIKAALEKKGIAVQYTDPEDTGATVRTADVAAVTLNSTAATESKNFGIDVLSQNAANTAIKTIDDAINQVSAERSKLGATQNRLDHTINNLTTTSENLSAAESRIRDVDMAKEMMNFTKNNILNQASTAMLAQANQMPQGVLQLLG